jgi:hypothetical protein
LNEVLERLLTALPGVVLRDAKNSKSDNDYHSLMATIVPGRKNRAKRAKKILNSEGYNLADKRQERTCSLDDTKWHMPIWHIWDRININLGILEVDMPFWHRRFWKGV